MNELVKFCPNQGFSQRCYKPSSNLIKLTKHYPTSSNMWYRALLTMHTEFVLAIYLFQMMILITPLLFGNISPSKVHTLPLGTYAGVHLQLTCTAVQLCKAKCMCRKSHSWHSCTTLPQLVSDNWMDPHSWLLQLCGSVWCDDIVCYLCNQEVGDRQWVNGSHRYV